MTRSVGGRARAVRIRPTADMEAIRALGVASGLDDSERGDEDVLAAWGAYDGGRFVGGVALERYAGLDVVNWMAVDGDWRRGIATRLLRALEVEARARGLGSLWATARNPAFFLANGYAPAPAADARALLGECSGCQQFGHGCEPQALTKSLRADAGGDTGYDGLDHRSGGAGE